MPIDTIAMDTESDPSLVFDRFAMGGSSGYRPSVITE